MNILHLDEQRGWRGGEQQASYLIDGLARRGHTVHIAGRANSAFLKAEHGGESVARIAAPFGIELDWWTALKLSIVVREKKIDILHAHTAHAHTIACLTRKLSGCGKVLVSRRVDFSPKRGLLSRWKYSMPDHYIAISQCIEKVLLHHGIPQDKVTCVHSGVDAARFDVRALLRSALKIPEDAVLLGSVGALVGHKDHETLIGCMPAVLRDVPQAHLVIAGDGPLRPRLQFQIERLELTERVHLLGHRSDVPSLLRSLDLFVMPSKEEGLGTSVLDAMVCGVPVVATSAGGLPEMVEDGVTGLLVPPQHPKELAGAIVRMIQDTTLGERLTRAGECVAKERFSVAAMVKGNLAVYERLLGR